MELSNELASKARKIKAIFFDVDGVLTDGSITYSSSGEELKSFNVKDGQIVKHLKQHAIIVGAVTGRSSEAVRRRCEELKLDFFEQGVKDKWALVQDKMTIYNLDNEDVCYIGDDIIDLKTIMKVGLGVAPNDAPYYIKAQADYVTQKNGGRGVLRETADLVLETKGLLEEVLKEYR